MAWQAPPPSQPSRRSSAARFFSRWAIWAACVTACTAPCTLRWQHALVCSPRWKQGLVPGPQYPSFQRCSPALPLQTGKLRNASLGHTLSHIYRSGKEPCPARPALLPQAKFAARHAWPPVLPVFKALPCASVPQLSCCHAHACLPSCLPLQRACRAYSAATAPRCCASYHMPPCTTGLTSTTAASWWLPGRWGRR